MRIYLYTSTILLMLLLLNLWIFYAPSTIELLLIDWVHLKLLHDNAAIVLILSNSVFSLALMCLLFAGYLFWRCDFVGAFIGLIALLMLLLINPLKDIFQRPRPLTDLGSLDSIMGFGFPSGHAIMAIVLLGVLVLLCRRFYRITNHRRTAIGGVVLYALIIGWTRLQLGVHYPSDVLAGYSIGVLVLLILARLDSMLRSHYYNSQVTLTNDEKHI